MALVRRSEHRVSGNTAVSGPNGKGQRRQTQREKRAPGAQNPAGGKQTERPPRLHDTRSFPERERRRRRGTRSPKAAWQKPAPSPGLVQALGIRQAGLKRRALDLTPPTAPRSAQAAAVVAPRLSRQRLFGGGAGAVSWSLYFRSSDGEDVHARRWGAVHPDRWGAVHARSCTQGTATGSLIHTWS